MSHFVKFTWYVFFAILHQYACRSLILMTIRWFQEAPIWSRGKLVLVSKTSGDILLRLLSVCDCSVREKVKQANNSRMAAGLCYEKGRKRGREGGREGEIEGQPLTGKQTEKDRVILVDRHGQARYVGALTFLSVF